MSNDLYSIEMPEKPQSRGKKGDGSSPTFYANQSLPDTNGGRIDMGALRFYADNPAHAPVIAAVRKAEAQMDEASREAALAAVTKYLLSNIEIRWVDTDKPKKELGLDFDSVLADIESPKPQTEMPLLG